MNGPVAATAMNHSSEEIRPDRRMYLDAFIRLGMLGIRNVADLGCGDGPFVDIMVEKAQRKEVYWGVDLDITRIEEARKKYPGWRFAYGDLMGDQVRVEFIKFDSFLLMNVLEYLEGDQDLDLIRSLPSGRPVVFSLPTFSQPNIVRLFSEPKDVYERYSPLVSIKYMGKFDQGPGRRWLMVTAFRW
jgi:trans-aconitate methyltransferase